MNILIVGSESRYIHLKNFSDELEKHRINSKVIIDTEFIEKSLSLDIKNRREKKRRREELLDFNPDLVVLDRISRLGEFFLNKKIPLFVLLRGNYWEELQWVKTTNEISKVESLSIYKNQKLAKKIFSESKGIIAISNYLKNEALKRYPGKKIDVIYADGRRISDWKKEETKQKFDHPCVGLVQGFDIWGKTRELQTLEKVLEKMPDVKFYLAGDGHNKNKIIPKLEKYENFIWLGKLEYPKKIKEMFSSIDIFLLLSGLEGLGQTVIEAMLMKKPIIATKIGGIPEIIKDLETGFLVDLGDSDKIIFQIRELLSNPELIAKITKNATKDIQRFSWENIAIEFLSVIKREIK